MSKKNPPPDIHKGDRVGFDFSEYEKKIPADSWANKNAWVTTEPFLINDVWNVSVSFDPDRFESYWERQASQKDINAPAQLLYIVEKNWRSRIKGKIVNTMKNISSKALVAGGIVLFLFLMGGWLAGNFNSLVTMNEDVDNSWSKVETQYQRRFDLIGNLVETVKSSQTQELSVIKEIADGRKTYTAAQASGDENGQAEAATKIETNVAALPKLLQEAYPELTSNQNVQSMMKELQGTENGINTVRDTYNDVVTNYNKGVLSFPKNIFATIFGYKERAQFKANAKAAEAPKVDFSKPATKE